MTDELTPKPRGRSGQSGKPRRPPDRMPRLTCMRPLAQFRCQFPCQFPCRTPNFPLPGGLALGS